MISKIDISLAGFLTAMGAYCYVAGFLIKNIYLSIYHIPPRGIVGLSYISTGLLFLSILILPLIPFLIDFFKPRGRRSKKNLRLPSIFISFGFSFICYLVIINFIFLSSPFYKQAWRFAVFLFFVINFIVFVFLFLIELLSTIPPIRYCKLLFIRYLSQQKIIGYLLIVIATLSFTPLYAFKIYPLIPQAIAGGYPEKVHLLFDFSKIEENQLNLLERIIENEKCIYTQELGNQQPKLCKSAEALLLDESADSYFILAPNRPICLDNKSVNKDPLFGFIFKNTLADFMKKSYRAKGIKKDLVKVIPYLQESFYPICKAVLQEKTILRFNIPKNDGYREIHIFRLDDNPNLFFMNIYNKWTNLTELNNVRLKRSEDGLTYTYESSNPKVDLYDKIVIKINEDPNVKTIKFKAQNSSFNNNIPEANSNPFSINFIDCNARKTIKNKNIYALLGDPERQNSKDMFTLQEPEAEIMSFPTIYRENQIVAKIHQNQHWFTKNKNPLILQELERIDNQKIKIGPLKVINKVKVAQVAEKESSQKDCKYQVDNHIWYQVIYNVDDTSCTTGWIRRDQLKKLDGWWFRIKSVLLDIISNC